MIKPFKTADLCDDHEGEVQICEPILSMFGGRDQFYGEIFTIKCFEDNSLVREQLNQPGNNRVLVVDGGGSLRCAMLGDQLAAAACKNNWVGIIMNGLIRDSADIAQMDLGVAAIGTIPIKSVKRGVGEIGCNVRFGGVIFRTGEYCYADVDGVICADKPLITS